MNLELLEALQNFVSEVNSAVNTINEHGMEFPSLDDSTSTLDSILHAHIEAEKAHAEVLNKNS